MKVTQENIKKFLLNMAIIQENYKTLKYWAKHGTNTQLPNDSIWQIRFHTETPKLSQVCSHIINKQLRSANVKKWMEKYEMIPNSHDCRVATLFASIIKREFAHVFDETKTEVDFDQIMDSEYSITYRFGDEVSKLGVGISNHFRTILDNYISRYSNDYTVPVLPKDNVADKLATYYRM